MDEEVVRFRRAAARENRGRQDVQRRYSVALQQQAADYWRVRARAGEGLRDVAAVLGVAPWSLRRWAHGARLHSVAVVPEAPAPPTAGRPVVVVVTRDTLRIEGLDVDTAAQLVARLR
jgi:predicted transcriptional regulator